MTQQKIRVGDRVKLTEKINARGANFRLIKRGTVGTVTAQRRDDAWPDGQFLTVDFPGFPPQELRKHVGDGSDPILKLVT